MKFTKIKLTILFLVLGILLQGCSENTMPEEIVEEKNNIEVQEENTESNIVIEKNTENEIRNSIDEKIIEDETIEIGELI